MDAAATYIDWRKFFQGLDYSHQGKFVDGLVDRQLNLHEFMDLVERAASEVWLEHDSTRLEIMAEYFLLKSSEAISSRVRRTRRRKLGSAIEAIIAGSSQLPGCVEDREPDEEPACTQGERDLLRASMHDLIEDIKHGSVIP